MSKAAARAALESAARALIDQFAGPLAAECDTGIRHEATNGELVALIQLARGSRLPVARDRRPATPLKKSEREVFAMVCRVRADPLTAGAKLTAECVKRRMDAERWKPVGFSTVVKALAALVRVHGLLANRMDGGGYVVTGRLPIG